MNKFTNSQWKNLHAKGYRLEIEFEDKLTVKSLDSLPFKSLDNLTDFTKAYDTMRIKSIIRNEI